MKPVQFDLKINPEALVTRAEEHLHFLRSAPRISRMQRWKVCRCRFRCSGIKYLTPILKLWSGFPHGLRREQGVSRKHELKLYPWR